jgi:hypothetical protein
MKQIKKELTPVPVTGRPAVDLKFIPPVTLSYQSTLDLKPVPAEKTKPSKLRPKSPVKRRRRTKGAG